MRLQKYLADAGVDSRRKCEELIRAGRVRVNGVVADIGAGVEDSDKVELDGKPVKLAQAKVVVIYYKPRGVLCSMSDPEGRKTVADVFAQLPHRLYNAGRLDINSEGLLIMTNDGELANGIMHPSHQINKTYRVLCDGLVENASITKLEKGIYLEDGLTSPAHVDNVNKNPVNNTTVLDITIHEGKNRQIRRMLNAVGHNTLRLCRTKVGPLSIKGLKSGEWRYLEGNEIKALYAALK